MSWRSAFEYSIRGGVAAARGALEGQVAAMQAQDERSYRERMLAYQNKMADVELYRAQSDAVFREKELGEKGRQADQAEATKRLGLTLGSDGKLYEVDETNKTARYVADLESETKETVAGIGAKATTDAATIKADADKSVATTVTEGKERTAAADRAMTYDVELLRAQTQQYSDDVKRDIAEKGYASNEAIAKWTLSNEAYKAELDAGGAIAGGAQGVVQLGLTPGQVDRVDALADDYAKEDDYKALQKLQREYFRATNAYNRVKAEALDPANEEAFRTGSADIALINIYQRFIDPGVSVREGDVELLQKGESIWNEIKVKYLDRAQAGYRLTPDAREEMFKLINDFYSTAMVELSRPLSERYQARIDLDGELRDSGVKVSNLGTDFWEDYGQTVARQKGILPAEAGEGDPDTSVPGLTEPGATEPTEPPAEPGAKRLPPPNSPERAQMIDSLARLAVDNKWTDAQLQEAVRKRWDADGIPHDEDFLIRVLERFGSMKPLEGKADNRPGQDFRNRGKKEADDADE